MQLQDKFEKDGNWLFRWRSYLPLFLLLIYIPALVGHQYLGGEKAIDQAWELGCLLVSLFGLVIRALTIGHTPQRTSGRNTKKQVAAKLNTTGIYSTLRHPLYLGNFFMMLGVTLFLHQAWPTVVFVLLFWLYYERIMFAEEAYLKAKFGQEFTAWAEQTPAIIPSFRNYRPAELPLSLKNVLRREYNGFLGFILPMFVLNQLSELATQRKLAPDWLWTGILIFGVCVWLLLRFLKKKTRLLVVEGR